MITNKNQFSQKPRRIEDLVEISLPKRVYVYLEDKETMQRFITDAESEGYKFGDGVKISKRKPDMLYALYPNKTVSFINFIGRMAFQSSAENIARINYKKYINGNINYLYKKGE